MKKLGLFLMFAIIVFSSYSQCPYRYIPDELYRGRFNEVGMVYGNSYTMFNLKKGSVSTPIRGNNRK